MFAPAFAVLAVLASAVQAGAGPAASPRFAPAPVSIQFRDASVVEGETIRLGDIARVMAGSEKAVAQLETLEVAKAAAFGLTRMIDTDALFARCLQPLSDRFLIEYDHKNIRVTTRAEVVSGDSLHRLIDGFLAAQAKRGGETWHWDAVRVPGEVMVPVAEHNLCLAFAGVKHKGKLDLNLAIQSRGKTLRTVPIAINLRVEEPVLVAKRQIMRDSILDQTSVAIEIRETTQFNETAMGDPAKLIGHAAKVTINPGRIITPRLVTLPPAVRRGQEAKIVFRNGGVSITADAVCRQDGIPGQIISAISLATHRLMRVRVTEAGSLEPVPGG